MHEPREGEIWDVLFDPQVGREQRGLRPALVISNDDFNSMRNDLHIVVPITATDRGFPFHVRIEAAVGGLTQISFIMCDQEKSQSIDRFVRRRGQVPDEILRESRKFVGRVIDAHRIFRIGV
jgi:mRNA interferase MazF